MCQVGGLDQAPGTLFALPMVDFPAGFFTIHVDWQLAGGGSSCMHHLFPVPVPVRASHVNLLILTVAYNVFSRSYKVVKEAKVCQMIYNF